MAIGKYRGYILFDDSDYPDYPNPKWKKRALHMNVRRDGIEEISPDHILALLNQASCHHFVWISKRIGTGELVHMIWVLAHELRHLVQNTLFPGLSEMSHILRPAVHGGFQLEIPNELDAELAAKDAVRRIVGEEQYQAYRYRQCANEPRAAAYFRRLDELEATWSGDPIAETLETARRQGVDLNSVRRAADL
jgi:hypothetical protein